MLSLQLLNLYSSQYKFDVVNRLNPHEVLENWAYAIHPFTNKKIEIWIAKKTLNRTGRVLNKGRAATQQA